MPRFAGHEAAYAEYAAWLETQDRAGEAADWRAFSRELAAGTLLGLGERAPDLVAAFGLVAAGVLLGAHFLLRLALAVRYRPVRRRDLATSGGGWLARLRHGLPAYHSPMERLSLLALLLLAVAALSLWTWGLRGASALGAEGLSAGTLGGAAFWANYGGWPAGPGRGVPARPGRPARPRRGPGR
jgi:hypothetical protein